MNFELSSWFADVDLAVATGSSRAEVAKRVAAAEALVARAPGESFVFDAEGRATLHTPERRYGAGRFSTPTLAELRRRVAGGEGGGRVSLAILAGTGAVTDVGTLQATATPGTLFQVASQFNCLEAPGPSIVPVSDYLHDYTQGPRASISAFPATLLRHYAAPGMDGERFVQTDARPLNLLDLVLDRDVARIRSGYLQTSEIRDVDRAAKLLVERFDQIKVGLHEDVEVVFGHDWGGPVRTGQRIHQALTSTVAQGGYGRDDGSAALREVRVQLLRGAYLGTLLSAVASGAGLAVLTLIGGGVFGNPLEDIWDAIFWACDEIEKVGASSLTVLVNGRESVTDEVKRALARRGGTYVALGRV
jgi:hypothetical protein